ncbi:MAG: shikimate dehydrogenase [Acidimicrobiia bacterium]
MRLALFGSPVRHSLSPAMHQAALAHVGIDGEYVARDVDEPGFVRGISELRDGELDGANVTMPHKVLAYRCCDKRTELAERAGAVNTLSRAGAAVVGDNTDVLGIREAWRWAGLPENDPVTILGAGGAAAAALLALGGRRLQIMARSADKALALLNRTGVAADVCAWNETPTFDGVVLNATPIGMRGERLDDRLLATATGLLDLAYGDTVTPAVVVMRESGRPVAEGLDMLIGQAAASFRIWTGRTVAPDVMRAAAQRELARRRAG